MTGMPIITRRTAIAAIALVALAAHASAQSRRFAGTVFYRERIALPQQAILTVRLVSLAKEETGERMLAEQIIAPAGQVPIAFVIEHDAPLDGELGLEASITVDGTELLATAEPVPVSPEGVEDLEILVVGSRSKASDGDHIAGVEWRVASIEGVADLAGTEPTLTIREDGAAAGSTGCNRYFAKATIDGEALVFSQAGTTFKACEEAAMLVERAFLDALTATAGYRLEDGALLLLDGEGVTRMRLVAGA